MLASFCPSWLFADLLDRDIAGAAADRQIDAIGGSVEIRRHVAAPHLPIALWNVDAAQPDAERQAYGYAGRDADRRVADATANQRLHMPLAWHRQGDISDAGFEVEIGDVELGQVNRAVAYIADERQAHGCHRVEPQIPDSRVVALFDQAIRLAVLFAQGEGGGIAVHDKVTRHGTPVLIGDLARNQRVRLRKRANPQLPDIQRNRHVGARCRAQRLA